MAHKKRRKRRLKPEDEYTSLSICVESYDVRADAWLNSNLKMDRPLDPRDDDPVFTFTTHIEITGLSTYPQERVGERYQITIRGEESEIGPYRLRLRDVHVRDEDRTPLYRTYRGAEFPVYDAPKGLATLSRRHGERVWDAWIYVAPHLASDMLTLLCRGGRLYLDIHERKTGRQRWIDSLSLQTSDPGEGSSRGVGFMSGPPKYYKRPRRRFQGFRGLFPAQKPLDFKALGRPRSSPRRRTRPKSDPDSYFVLRRRKRASEARPAATGALGAGIQEGDAENHSRHASGAAGQALRRRDGPSCSSGHCPGRK